MTKKPEKKALPIPVSPDDDPARIIGEAVGRISATLADSLPRLSDLDGKRLLRHMASMVKSEMDFSDK